MESSSETLDGYHQRWFVAQLVAVAIAPNELNCQHRIQRRRHDANESANTVWILRIGHNVPLMEPGSFTCGHGTAA